MFPLGEVICLSSLFCSFSSEDSNKKPGTPGTPGSHDLEAALRRLSLRRDNYLSERRFFEEERERKLLALAGEKREPCGDSDGEGGGSLTDADSILSLGNLHSVYSIYSTRSYLPEKLQIVKPLEGDQNKDRPPVLHLLDTFWALIHQHSDDLSTQHSFYFRHAHPRCWFEI